MEKLTRLCKECSNSITLSINEHRDVYQSVEQFLEERNVTDEDVSPEIKQEMIRQNSIIELQFYPVSAGGFYLIYHYDVDMALEEALFTLENEPSQHDQSI